ncbi:hypothetical protein SDC9_77461 [bioreactor metagenome]|uniref:G5 domain-containing protein n=1 Tax=bioreactor metagenome TaxID=1076179 RepID=A0A644YSF7_9ZZZZ
MATNHLKRKKRIVIPAIIALVTASFLFTGLTIPRTQYVVTRETIPYENLRVASSSLLSGKVQLAQQGASGLRTCIRQIITVPGQEPMVTFEGVSITAEPKSQIEEYGTKVPVREQSWLSTSDDVLTNLDTEVKTITTASGQTYAYSKVLTCTATAYTTERQSWKLTATGTTARVGAIAVDPKVIPYGTSLYIVSADGSITYGIATAEDCGGSIKGQKIDLFFNTYYECIQFGRRPCTVYVLK